MVHCWKYRTALEKGLILMISVTIPLLLMLIIMNTLFLTSVIPPNSLYTTDNDTNTTTTTATPEKRFRRFVTSASNYNFIDIKNKSNSNDEDLVCECFKIEYCYNLFEPHKFISSISEPIYEDDPNDYKYKCAAVLLSESYILSSSNCLTNGALKMRICSEYWSKDGYTRQISSIRKLSNSITIGQLSKPLINDRYSIKFIKFSDSNNLNNIKQVDTYQWNSKYTQVLENRKQYNKLYKTQLNITECMDMLFNGFCSLETGINNDLEYEMVFKMETDRLLGIEVKRIVRENKTEHYYVFVNKTEIEKHKL